MLKRKHLSALSLASIPYKEEWVEGPDATFLSVSEEYVVPLIEFLHKNFTEDIPIIPLKIESGYIIYIHNND